MAINPCRGKISFHARLVLYYYIVCAPHACTINPLLNVDNSKNALNHVFLVLVCVCNMSTDHTAMLWSIETGKCLLKYLGHQGSGRLTNVLCIYKNI